jgi:hypothetical protein
MKNKNSGLRDFKFLFSFILLLSLLFVYSQEEPPSQVIGYVQPSKRWEFQKTKLDNNIKTVFEQINDTVLKITISAKHENIPANYKWNIAICSPNITYLEDYEINETNPILLDHINIIDEGMSNSWCNETNNMGSVLFSAGSRNQLPKSFVIDLGDNTNFTMYSGDGSEVSIGTVLDAIDEHNMAPPGVFINSTTGYVVFGESNAGLDGLVFRKTTDGGTTWGSSTLMSSSGQDFFGNAVWYDQWTPGDDSGTIIHVCGQQPNTDYLEYYTINTTNDAVTKDLVNDQGALTATDGGCAITKGTDGMIWIGGQLTNSMNVFNSTDGDTWTLNTPGTNFDDDDDYFQLLPLSGGDIIYIYRDTTESDTYWGNWNATSATWENVGIELLGTGGTSGAIVQDGATVNKQTNDVFWVYKTSWGAPGSVVCKFFNDTNRSWSAKTGTSYEGNQVNIMTNNNNGDLYMIYAKGASGLTDIFYRNSTDNSDTWGDETQLSTTQDDLQFVKGTMNSDTKIYAFWYNDDTNEILGGTILNITVEDDETPPEITSVTNQSVTNQSAKIKVDTDESANLTVNYGTTASLGTFVYNTTFQTTTYSILSSLLNNTFYYYNVTSCDSSENCQNNGTFGFTTSQNTGGDTCDTTNWDCTEECTVDGLDAGGSTIYVTASGSPGTIEITGDVTNCNYGNIIRDIRDQCVVVLKNGAEFCPMT